VLDACNARQSWIFEDLKPQASTGFRMKFLLEISAALLGYAFAGWILVLIYVAFQWLTQMTDVTCAYTWIREADKCHPIFNIRNRSDCRTYTLAEISYSNGPDGMVRFDSMSLMGKELGPGSSNDFWKVAPIKCTSSIADCLELHVSVHLQTGSALWLDDRAPVRGRQMLRHLALAMRALMDSVPKDE
jgi:hypothetical protein